MTCQACGAAVTDAALCAACTREVADALARVGWLTGELDVLLARQSATGVSNGGGSGMAVAPLPYDLRASQSASRLHDVLVRWAGALPLSDVVPPGSPALAALIAASLAELRQLPDADRAHRELTRAVERAERTIDLPPERWFAGPCPDCGQDAYALPAAAVVSCGCGWEADAAERRRWLLQEAEDTLANATLIAQALSGLGQPVTGSMIRGYAFRGRLVAHGTDRLGRPLYRIGDLLDILSQP